ncbi:MAG: hypothetical protein SXV54_20570 [Chloroflexota bacterium]|nr:hypothetical protein [Chloroflexota bacterium]
MRHVSMTVRPLTQGTALPPGRETWKRTSTGEQLHRCRYCWSLRADDDGVVDDNGFVPANEPYPHMPNCPYAGQF